MRDESGGQGATMHRVLVLGERPEEGKALASDLSLRGYEVTSSPGSSTSALRSLVAFGPDAIVLDLNSGGTNHELLHTLLNASRQPIIVLADHYAESDLVWNLEDGAAAYLAKPLSPGTLCAQLTA